MMGESENQVLLVMDIQPGIIDRLSDKEAFIERVVATIASARAHNIPVIYVVVAFRPELPEVSAQNKGLSTIRESGAAHLINATPLLPITADDVVVSKRRVSAFSGSDLEILLRTGEFRHLILSGIVTSGVVLSTVREAADKDYRLTVLSDLCGDPDPEVHSILINKIFPRQATVLTSDQWIATL